MKGKITFCLILGFLCAATSLTVVSGQESARSTAIQIMGLKDRVTIRRDERGIPYIEAANEDDLYFAQGYITASDRLWQMDLMRRNVRGELAEVLGPAVLTQDQRHRTLGFARIVDATAARMPPHMRSVLEAYARGVNAFIESRTSQNLPPEFLILQYKPQPWRAADSLAIGKLLYEVLSNTWPSDVMRASLANLPQAKREALLPETSPLDVLVVGAGAKDSPKRTTLQPLPTPKTHPPERVLVAAGGLTK